jgi:hypothetical protein
LFFHAIYYLKRSLKFEIISEKNMIKPIRLSQCDIDILSAMKFKPEEIMVLHDKLSQYSDQEISLTISWLEKKNFIKKNIFTRPDDGRVTISYGLDQLGKEYLKI